MPKHSKKVIVFYSSIGNGHLVAAQAIRQEILRQDPSARVMLKDIRAFMNPAWRRIDERLFWFVAKHLPESFETLFRTMQARGSRVSSLSLLPNDYPEEKVLAFLESLCPDAALATHYGAAQVLGTLREQELLANIRLGWLHTDFFEGYFPRISKRIDLTFLGHSELEARWRAAGVPQEKVTTTGMPVRIPEEERNSDALLTLGLAANIPTVLITGGKEGAGDFFAVLESIARQCQRSLQIIAVCGTNKRLRSQLEALQAQLPQNIAFKALGLVPHGEMLSLMRSSDLLITKAGGMTPSEAFALGTPTILLDVVSGHERKNAAMFARLGLAELATEAAEVGGIVESFVSNPARSAAMLEAQRDFREAIQISRIAQFALDDSFVPVCLPRDFGAENGTPVTDIGEALANIDSETPASVELLLSYATSQSPQPVVMENPFGHLAIRIGDIVYSANHLANRETDPNFLQHLSLADYLYGVQPPSNSQVHTNTYGLAYGRETLGLRISGVPPDSTAAMVAEALSIEEQFCNGDLHWDRSGFNCADVVARILRAGGYDCQPRFDWLGLPSMPLGVFERARSVLNQASGLNLDLVAYRQIPGAQASYHFSRFPLSVGHPLRSVARVLNTPSQDPLEMAVTKQVTAYFGDQRLFLDILLPQSADNAQGGTADRSKPQHLRLESALMADMRHLLATYARLPFKEMERLGSRPAAKELRRLIDHGQEIARIAMERAEELGLHPHRKQLRSLFGGLLREYERLGTHSLQIPQLKAYLKRLRIFQAAVMRDFSQLGVPQPRRTRPLSRSVRRHASRLGRHL